MTLPFRRTPVDKGEGMVGDGGRRQALDGL